MKAVRWLLGRLILLIDFITRPKPLQRSKAEQDKVDAITSNMSLYQFHACPFCVKVRRQIRKQSLNITLKDAKNDPVIKDELTRQGGKHKVPCLKIESGPGKATWLYDSKEIISYLETEFQAA